LIVIGRYQKERYIPFGPFIAAGSIVACLWGNDIIEWYIGLVL
jgi:leader peptidase (prepilin peptidase)/N-methyltransferase